MAGRPEGARRAAAGLPRPQRFRRADGPRRGPRRPELRQGTARRRAVSERMGLRGPEDAGGARHRGGVAHRHDGRLRALHAARPAEAGPLCLGREGACRIRRPICGRGAPERRLLAPPLPNGHGEPADGDCERARVDPGARRHVGRHQPGDGERIGGPGRKDRLHGRRLLFEQGSADVAPPFPQAVLSRALPGHGRLQGPRPAGHQTHRRQPVADHGHDHRLGHRLSRSDRPEGRHEHSRGQDEVRASHRHQGQRRLRGPPDLRLRRGDGRSHQAGAAGRYARRRLHPVIQQQHSLRA